MALSLNPVSKITKNISSNLATAANQTGGNIARQVSDTAKSSLDSLVASKSGAVGSKLNGITGSLRSTSLSNLSGTVQTRTGTGGVNSLTGSIGGLFNSVKSQVENLAAGVAPGLATGLIQGALQKASAQGSLLAGIASDLISAARQKNVPTAATLGLTKPGSVVAVYPVEAGDWRVKVQSTFGDITFPTTPTFSFTHTAQYDNKPLVHSNFPHPVYVNSTSGDIQVSAEFPVETSAEADEWYRIINLGRALTKMFYGSSDPAVLGNPPPICELVGYQNTIGRIPVIVKEFKVDFKDDVHYIDTGSFFVPRMSTISMTLQPVYSKSSQRFFNWEDYSAGFSNIPY